MITKILDATIERDDAKELQAKVRPKLTIDEQISYMQDVKGIKF